MHLKQIRVRQGALDLITTKSVAGSSEHCNVTSSFSYMVRDVDMTNWQLAVYHIKNHGVENISFTGRVRHCAESNCKTVLVKVWLFHRNLSEDCARHSATLWTPVESSSSGINSSRL